MYNLIRFIQKHYFILLFILLEVICVLLLSTSQSFHRQALVNSTNDAIGGIYSVGNNIGNYFRLGKINKELAEENANLRNQLSIINDTSTIRYQISDIDTIYQYIPAEVVSSTINQRNNYLVINKGKKDGIERDMGVISADGIVGVVSDISNHYATVISLLHSYSVVGVRFKDNQHLANLKWGTNSYRFGTVEDIPTHLQLQKGDTIVTSSYSFIYPEDLMVGTVEEFYTNQSGDLNKAKIRFSTNFATLRNVYVIKNLYQAELDSLNSQRPKI